MVDFLVLNLARGLQRTYGVDATYNINQNGDNTMTTLEAFCKCLGWQGGTIHAAKQRFAIASLREMDNICGYLLQHADEISDLKTVQYFTEKRMEAIGLHDIALND